MLPFAPVEKNSFPSCGKTEHTISSLQRHNVFTTPSGRISSTALCAFASPPLRRVCTRGVAEETGSSGSMTCTSCGAAAAELTVTVTVGCGFEVLPVPGGAAAGMIEDLPLIAEA